MISMTLLRAPYEYVRSEGVIDQAQALLWRDCSVADTGITSLTLVREQLANNSLLQLRGLGKEIWRGVEAQQHVNELRDEWENDV